MKKKHETMFMIHQGYFREPKKMLIDGSTAQHYSQHYDDENLDIFWKRQTTFDEIEFILGSLFSETKTGDFVFPVGIL